MRLVTVVLAGSLALASAACGASTEPGAASAVQLKVLSPTAGGSTPLPANISYEVSGANLSPGGWTLRVEVDLGSEHPAFDFPISTNAGTVTLAEDKMLSGRRDLVVSLRDGSGAVRATVRLAGVTLEGGRGG